MKKGMLAVLMSAMFVMLFGAAGCDDFICEYYGNQFGSVNFLTYRDICFDSNNPDARHLAAVEMAKLADSIDDWQSVSHCAKYGSDLEKMADNKQLELAKQKLSELAE